MKQILKGGAEWDWTSRWRHLYCYTDRPGVGKSIKRGMNKRHRREGKQAARIDILSPYVEETRQNRHISPQADLNAI